MSEEVVRTVIDVDINTGNAAAVLRSLQSQINSFQTSLSRLNSVQSAAAQEYAAQLKATINQSQYFTAEVVKMRTAAAQLDDTLARGRGTMAQFLGARFAKNGSTAAQVMQLARTRAAALQTQFIATGAAANGFQEALAVRPMQAFNKEAAVTAERLAIQRAMLTQATTSMLNFGKNTQWAGRQLMVGFTVPLTLFGAVAGKTFMDLQKQILSFKKVYGDAFTTNDEIDQALVGVQKLAKEYTRYGVAVKDTLDLAAQAAAAGFQSKDLIEATTQSTRLAVLGQMEQNEALTTTISLQNAFKISSKDLGKTVDFLNQVENQTVVTLQDLAAAIPRVAPVIKGLGGSVQDMAAFMAAMQEGGVSAAQGANALKSGLASLINPTKKAVDALQGLGINMNTIINANRGDLMGTVKAFGQALATLDDFSKQQALEKVFGKWQYARLGALFTNIIKDGTQASRVMDIASLSAEKLAQSSEKELRRVSDNPATQFTAAMERMKLAIAPIGEMFVKVGTVVVGIVTKIADAFNNLPDGVKSFAAIAAIITGIAVPAGTMFLGLLLNLTGTLIKFGHIIGVTFKGLITGGPKKAFEALTQSIRYMSLAEIDTSLASKQLGEATENTTAAILEQATAAGTAQSAILDLGAAYVTLAQRMQEASAANAGVFGVAGSAMSRAERAPITVRRIRRAFGGTIPGSGNSDTVPAMLTPGEYVVNKRATQQNLPLLHAINSGAVKGYANGGEVVTLEAMRARAISRGMMESREASSAALSRIKGAVSPDKRPTLYDILFPNGALDSSVKIQRRHNYWTSMPKELLNALNVETLGGLVANLPTTLNQKFRGNGAFGSEVIELIRNSGLTPEQIYSPIMMQMAGFSGSQNLALNPAAAYKSLMSKIASDTVYKDANFTTLFRESLMESMSGSSTDIRRFMRASTEARSFKLKGTPGMSTLDWANSLPMPNGYKLEIELARSKANPTGKHSKTRIYIRHQDGTKMDITPNSEFGTISSNEGIMPYERLRSRGGSIPGVQYTHVNTGGHILGRGQVRRFAAGGRVPLFLGKLFGMSGRAGVEARLARADMLSRSGRYASLPVTDLGKLKHGIGGYSSTLPGLNGIYEGGVFKALESPDSALLEARSAHVMNSVFNLKSPNQRVVKIKHPVTGQLITGVLSPFDSTFANPTGVFAKGDIADQIIAAAVRRDRDGQPDNIFGRVVADNGPSIFGINDHGDPRASEPRFVGPTTRSASEQLAINMLQTKGGAKKFFAEASANAARQMTESEYVSALKESINAAKRRVFEGVRDLPMATTEEKDMYARRLLADLNDLENVDFGRLYQHHVGLFPSDNTMTPSQAAKRAARKAQEARTTGHNVPMRYGIPGFNAGGLVMKRLQSALEGFEVVERNGVTVLRNKAGNGEAVAQVIGKFQPFTSGHQGLVLDTLEEAKRRGADFILGTSLAHGTRSNNGLDPQTKFDFIRKAVPGIEPQVLPSGLKDYYKTLAELGYKEMITSVGTDRGGNKAYRSLAEKAGMKFTEKITDRADGISGTAARDAAIGGDFATFRSILPPNISSSDAKNIFDIYRAYAIGNGYAGGGIVNAALRTWATSASQVRNNTTYLEAIKGLIGKSRLPKPMSMRRRTTVGLSKGSEFSPEMEQFLLRATPEELASISDIMIKGPFSATSGVFNGIDDTVSRIEFLKETHAKNRRYYLDAKKMVARIDANGGPKSWESRLYDERMSTISSYRDRQHAIGKEIKSLSPRGYRILEMLLEIDKGTPGFKMNKQSIMGRPLYEDEHVFGSGKYKVSGIKAYNTGGNVVPGTGNKDTVPAMLTPGEFVINKKATQQNMALLHAINSGKMQGFATGGLASRYMEKTKGLGQKGMGFSMGLGSAGGAMMMLPMLMGDSPLAGIGSAAGMGLSVLSMAPMLGPALAPVVALGSIAAVVGMSLKVWRNAVDDNAKKAAQLGANMGGTANSLKTMSDLLSVATPEMSRNKVRAGLTKPEEQVVNDQFSQIFQSEAGQKFIDDLKNSTSADRFRKLGDYVASAIASGMMDKTSGQAFAKSVGILTGDAALGTGVATSIRGQSTGSFALEAMANKRAEAVFGGTAANNVANDARVSYEQASTVIGGAIQVMQDYSNVQAMAEEEYRNGTITFQKYIDTVNEARIAQDKANKALSDALLKSSDSGGSQQAFKEQLILAGVSEDQQNAIDDAISRGLGDAPRTGVARWSQMGQDKESRWAAQNTFKDFLPNAAKTAAGKGLMSPQDAAQLAQYLLENPTGLAANVFKNSGADAEALNNALFAANRTEQPVQGIDTRKYIASAMSFQSAGGNIADFDAAVNNMAENLRVQFIDTINKASNKEGKLAVINDNQTLSQLIGADSAGLLQSSKAYAASLKTNSTKDIVNVMNAASESGVQDKIINYVINTEGSKSPEEFTKKVKDITKNVKALNALPDDIVKGLKIDIENPKDVEHFGPMADSLQKNWGILENLNKNIDMVAAMNFLVNGGKASPEEVSAKVVSLNKAFKNLSSGKASVRKQAQIDIAIAYAGKSGLVDEGDAAQTAITKLHKDFKNFDKLDPIIQTQMIKLYIDVEVEGAKLAAKANRLQDAYKRAVESGDPLAAAMIADKLDAVNKKKEGMAAKAAAARARANALASTDSGNGSGSGGSKEKSIIQVLKEALRDTQSIYAAMQVLLAKNKEGFKNFISGPFAPEFIDYLKQQGEKGIKILKEHGAKFREAYDLFKAQQLQEAVNVKQALPSSMARQSQVTMGKSRAYEQLTKAGVGNEEANNIISAFSEGAIAEYNKQSMKANRISQSKYGKNYFDLNRKQQKKVLSKGNFGEPDLKALYLFKFGAKDIKTFEQATYEANAAQVELQKTTLENAKVFRAMNIPADIADKLADMGIQAYMSEKYIRKLAKSLQDAAQAEWNNKDITEKRGEFIDTKMNILDLRRQIDEATQVKPLQDQIDALNEQNSILDRQVELKNRIIEGIDDQIDKYNDQIDDLNTLYDDQIKALDEIEAANERIYKIQSGQLSIANALSRGDVAGAAQAMQELQQNLAESRNQSTRDALELAHANALKAIQDKIDALTAQRKVVENDIKNIQAQQRLNSDAIYSRQLSIDGITKALNVKYDQTNLKLQSMNNQLAIAEQHWQNINRLANGDPNAPAYTTAANQPPADNASAADKVAYARQIAAQQIAANNAKAKKMNGGRIYRFASGGSVPGTGMTDKVPAMLTPGEFVVRKAVAEKIYPLLDGINGSYGNFTNIASIGTQAGNTSNQYNIDVRVAGSNASPEDIANAVVGKIKMINDQNIRSYNNG